MISIATSNDGVFVSIKFMYLADTGNDDIYLKHSIKIFGNCSYQLYITHFYSPINNKKIDVMIYWNYFFLAHITEHHIQLIVPNGIILCSMYHCKLLTVAYIVLFSTHRNIVSI